MERQRLQAIVDKITRHNTKYEQKIMVLRDISQPSAMQKTVDKMFEDILEMKRRKLMKSINQMRRACGETPIGLKNDDTSLYLNSETDMQVSNMQSTILADDQKNQKTTAPQVKPFMMIPEQLPREQEVKSQLLPSKKKENDDDTLKNSTEEFKSVSLTSESEQRIAKSEQKISSNSIKTSVDLTSEEQDSFDENGELLVGDKKKLGDEIVADPQKYMKTQEIKEFPDKNFKMHCDLTYKKAPNYVKAFLLPQSVIDQKLEPPVTK